MNQATNVTQSQAAANAQGYSFTQSFQFSPSAANDATVGTGTNETAVCNLIPDAGAKTACMQDTTYAVAYDAVNHKILPGSARTPNARSVSGVWDAGAYTYSSSQPLSVDISLTLVSSPASVAVGGNVNYLFTVANNSTQTTATNLQLTDTLPAGMSYVSATAAGGSCSTTGSTVRCTLASLAPQATWQPSISVTAGTAGSITNTASVTASQPDPDTSNNTTSTTTSVQSTSGGSGGTSGGGGGAFGWLSLLLLVPCLRRCHKAGA